MLRWQADVARESVLRVAPDIKIVSHHASVFEERFGISWVKGFDIVLNALDNIKAALSSCMRIVDKECVSGHNRLLSGAKAHEPTVHGHRKAHGG